jgi:hypothetical protein
MSDFEFFPELIESRRLDLNRMNGVDQARLTIGARGDAVVTSRDEVAALQNVLGVYLIDPDETIRDPEIVFMRIEHAEPLPGGGLLEPGDAVRLSNLHPTADLAPDRSSACIVIPDDAGSLINLYAPSAGSSSHVNSFPSSLPLCRGGNPAHRRAR